MFKHEISSNLMNHFYFLFIRENLTVVKHIKVVDLILLVILQNFKSTVIRNYLKLIIVKYCYTDQF